MSQLFHGLTVGYAVPGSWGANGTDAVYNWTSVYTGTTLRLLLSSHVAWLLAYMERNFLPFLRKSKAFFHLEELPRDIQILLLRSMRLTRRHLPLVFFICYYYLLPLNITCLNSFLHSYYIQIVHYRKECQISRAMTLSLSYSRYCTIILMEKLTTVTENLRKVIQLSAVITNGYLPDMNEAPKKVHLMYVVRIHYKFHKLATGVSNRYYPMHHTYMGKWDLHKPTRTAA